MKAYRISVCGSRYVHEDGKWYYKDDVDAKIASLERQAKIEVLEDILANAENWHFENYGYPLRGETGNEAVAIELRETRKVLVRETRKKLEGE